MKKDIKPTQSELDHAARLTTRHSAQHAPGGYPSGGYGEWLEAAFDDINERFFDGGLPFPLITLVDGGKRGRVVGWTYTGATIPTICIQTAAFGVSEKLPVWKNGETPWGVSADKLGPAYVYDILMHECIHLRVAQRELAGEGNKPFKSHHDNPIWIDECSRLAKELGLAFKGGTVKVAKVKDDGVWKSKRVFQGESPVGYPGQYRFPHPLRPDGHYANPAPVAFPVAA